MALVQGGAARELNSIVSRVTCITPTTTLYCTYVGILCYPRFDVGLLITGSHA